MTRPRIVIAGLGDAGLLTAINLSPHVDVVGITSRPGLLSGKELGIRLTRPADWVRDSWISFDRYRRLDPVRTVHGTLTGVDLASRTVHVSDEAGVATEEPYDVLVISTGVANGFWRRPGLFAADDVRAELDATHTRLGKADAIAVIGGGGAAVSSASTWRTPGPTARRPVLSGRAAAAAPPPASRAEARPPAGGARRRRPSRSSRGHPRGLRLRRD